MAKQYYVEKRGMDRSEFISWYYILKFVYRYLIQFLIGKNTDHAFRYLDWHHKLLFWGILSLYLLGLAWLMFARGKNLGYSLNKNLLYVIALLLCCGVTILDPFLVMIGLPLTWVVLYSHFTKPANFELNHEEDIACKRLKIVWLSIFLLSIWLVLK